MKNDNNTMSVVALVLSIIAVLLSVYTLGSVGKSGGAAAPSPAVAAPTPAPTPSAPVDVSIDDDAILGDKDAPVTIVEFSDYECPYCKRFRDGTLKEIEEKYINTGKVKLVYRDFPLSFHANAKTAAMAAECAKVQGGDDAYYEYHDKIFENQRALNETNYKAWAGELGLDQGKFDSCYDNRETEAEVDNDFNEGSSYGVRGTPAFFVNGNFLSGAQPFVRFEALIEAELNK